MSCSLKLDSVNNTATFTGLTPDSIGAASQYGLNTLDSEVDALQLQLNNAVSQLNSLSQTIATLQTKINNLTPTDVKLSSIKQRQNGEIELNAGTFVNGQLTAYAKIETRIAEHGLTLQPWSETTKESVRFDLWANANTKTYELSLFRATTGTSGPVALAIYRTTGTDTINHWLSANGNSYVCSSAGNFGIGTNNPTDKFQVNGGFIKCSTGIRIGSNQNSLSYTSAVPVGGTYARGDILFNLSPSASGFVGWVCVVAGTPGTWKTFGAISA